MDLGVEAGLLERRDDRCKIRCTHASNWGAKSGAARSGTEKHRREGIIANSKNAARLRQLLRDRATSSFEHQRSPPQSKHQSPLPQQRALKQWAERDSNPRRRKSADLQSALVGHLSIRPNWLCPPLRRVDKCTAAFGGSQRSERGLARPHAPPCVTRRPPAASRTDPEDRRPTGSRGARAREAARACGRGSRLRGRQGPRTALA